MTCIYIYIYVCNHENNEPSQISPQWVCGNSCAWTHELYIMCPSAELPQSHWGDKWEGTLFSWLNIYYAHLAAVRFLSTLCVKDPLWPFKHIYPNLPRNIIVRLPHPLSRDTQGQEMFLASSADKQTCNSHSAQTVIAIQSCISIIFNLYLQTSSSEMTFNLKVTLTTKLFFVIK